MECSRVLSLWLVWSVAVTALGLLSKAEDASEGVRRLPLSPFPVRYSIKLMPEFELMSFQGSVKTELVIDSKSFDRFTDESSSFSIQFHRANDLRIEMESVRLVFNCGDTSTKTLFAENEEFDLSSEISEIKFNQRVSEVKQYSQQCGGESSNLTAVLSASFNGTLRNDQSGLYLSKYAMPDSTIVTNAVSRFQATGARAVFPSWDEPSFKARMKIALIIPQDSVALSNAPLSDEEEMNHSDCPFIYHNGTESSQCKQVFFEETPPISTYSVSFVIGDYQSIVKEIQLKNNRTLLLRIWLPHSYSDDLRDFDVALNDSSVLPGFYESLFVTEYPFKILDIVGVTAFPNRPESVAGMIFLRSSMLSTRQSSKSFVSATIAEQISQLWFGAMVSPKWWDSLWLIQSFSKYIAMLGMNFTHPELDFEEWVLRATDDSLNKDIDVEDSHPLQSSVMSNINPQMIDKVMDNMDLDKGRALIRMLAEMMGHSHFFSGVRDLFDHYGFGNVNSEDFWNVLQPYYAKNDTLIADVMNGWISDSGFPVVSVSLDEEMIDGDHLILTLDQCRMLDTFQGLNESRYNSQEWSVPVIISDASDDGVKPVLVLSNAQGRITVSRNVLKNGDEYYLINPVMNGYFRVDYGMFKHNIKEHYDFPDLNTLSTNDCLFILITDDTLLDIIIASFSHLNQYEQYTLLSDQIALMLNGHIPVNVFLDRFTKMVTSLNEYMQSHREEYTLKVTLGVWDRIQFALLNLMSKFCEFGIQYSFDYFLTVGVGEGGFDQSWVLDDPDTLVALQRFTKHMVHPMWRLIGGWNTRMDHSSDANSAAIRDIRVILTNVLIYADDENVVQSGWQLMYDVEFDVNQVEPHLLQHLIAACLRYRPSETLAWIKSSLSKWTSNQRRSALSAIGTLNFDEDFMVDGLELVLSKKVRDNERVNALIHCRQCHGRYAVWNQVFEDEEVWQSIIEDDPESLKVMTELPEYLSTFYMLDRYQEFFINDASKGSHIYNSENEESVNRTERKILSQSNWLVLCRRSTHQWLDLNGFMEDDYDEYGSMDDSSEDESSEKKERNQGTTAALILAGAFFCTALAIIMYRVLPPKQCRRLIYLYFGCCCRPSGYSRQSQNGDYPEEYEWEDSQGSTSGTRTVEHPSTE